MFFSTDPGVMGESPQLFVFSASSLAISENLVEFTLLESIQVGKLDCTVGCPAAIGTIGGWELVAAEFPHDRYRIPR